MYSMRMERLAGIKLHAEDIYNRNPFAAWNRSRGAILCVQFQSTSTCLSHWLSHLRKGHLHVACSRESAAEGRTHCSSFGTHHYRSKERRKDSLVSSMGGTGRGFVALQGKRTAGWRKACQAKHKREPCHALHWVVLERRRTLIAQAFEKAHICPSTKVLNEGAIKQFQAGRPVKVTGKCYFKLATEHRGLNAIQVQYKDLERNATRVEFQILQKVPKMHCKDTRVKRKYCPRVRRTSFDTSAFDGTFPWKDTGKKKNADKINECRM